MSLRYTYPIFNMAAPFQTGTVNVPRKNAVELPLDKSFTAFELICSPSFLQQSLEQGMICFFVCFLSSLSSLIWLCFSVALTLRRSTHRRGGCPASRQGQEGSQAKLCGYVQSSLGHTVAECPTGVSAQRSAGQSGVRARHVGSSVGPRTRTRGIIDSLCSPPARGCLVCAELGGFWRRCLSSSCRYYCKNLCF